MIYCFRLLLVLDYVGVLARTYEVYVKENLLVFLGLKGEQGIVIRVSDTRITIKKKSKQYTVPMLKIVLVLSLIDYIPLSIV